MPEPKYVFTFPGGKTRTYPIAWLQPGHKNYEDVQYNIAGLTDQLGDPEVEEKGWQIPGMDTLKKAGQAGILKMAAGVPEGVRGLLGSLDPMKNAGAAIDMVEKMVPEEISAEAIRTSTDVALPSIGGILGMAAGGATGPAAPAMIPSGGAAGGMLGQKLAGKLQEAAGVQPSGASPMIAGAIEGLAPPLMTKGLNMVKGATRGLLGGKVAGEAAETTMARVEDAAGAYRRLGIDDPALPQLIQQAGGSVPFRNMMTTLQQLNIDLPFFQNVTEGWLRKNLNSLNATLTKKLGAKSVQAVSDDLRQAVITGTKSAERGLGREMDEVFMSYPGKSKELISIKPIIDELADLGVVKDGDLLKRLAAGDKSEAIFADFVRKYGTPTGQPGPGGGVGYHFRDAPVGEIDAFRKALGETFKNSESALSKKIAESNRHRIYSATRDSVRSHTEVLERAGTIPSGSVAKYETAMEKWSANKIEETKYIDKLVKLTTPETRLTAKISGATRGEVPDAKQIRAIKKRVLNDPTMKKESWRDVQNLIIERKSFKGGNFDMGKFRNWYEGMDDAIRNELFDAEHRSLLKDLFQVTEGPWPVPRATGPTFVSQQLGRPIAIAGGIGAIHGGGALASGGESKSAFQTGTTSAAIAMLSMFLAPAMAQKAMTSKKALKFLKTTATMSPKEYHNHVGAIIGGLVNSIANPDNEGQYQDALAIYAAIDARTQLETLILSQGQDQQGQGQQQMPGQMRGLFGGN